MAEFDLQEFGRLQAQVETLIDTNRVNTETLATLSAAIQSMQLQMAEAKGGWRALMLIGGASASLGSFATWALTHLAGRGPT